MTDAAFRGTGTQYQFISLAWGCKWPGKDYLAAVWEVAGVRRLALQTADRTSNGWIGLPILADNLRRQGQAPLIHDAVEEVAIERREAVGMPGLGALVGGAAGAVVFRRVIP